MPRRNRRIQERVHDPYRAINKPAEPTVCPECGAVFRSGRWQWAKAPPARADAKLCQACARSRDGVPAGEVRIEGRYARQHREEILLLLCHEETKEKNLHPMHRIINVENQRRAMIVRTTDLHLPHRLGQALHRAHKGTLSTRYGEQECFVRVRWARES